MGFVALIKYYLLDGKSQSQEAGAGGWKVWQSANTSNHHSINFQREPSKGGDQRQPGEEINNWAQPERVQRVQWAQSTQWEQRDIQVNVIFLVLMIVIISIPSSIDDKQTMLYNIVEHIILSDILCVLSTPVIAITYHPAPHTYAGLAKEISLCCFCKKKITLPTHSPALCQHKKTMKTSNSLLDEKLFFKVLKMDEGRGCWKRHPVKWWNLKTVFFHCEVMDCAKVVAPPHKWKWSTTSTQTNTIGTHYKIMPQAKSRTDHEILVWGSG